MHDVNAQSIMQIVHILYNFFIAYLCGTFSELFMLLIYTMIENKIKL